MSLELFKGMAVIFAEITLTRSTIFFSSVPPYFFIMSPLTNPANDGYPYIRYLLDISLDKVLTNLILVSFLVHSCAILSKYGLTRIQCGQDVMKNPTITALYS